MNEFELIAHLERRLSKPSIAVEVGIGDDAAVVSAGGGLRWAVTTDAMVEDVHFSLKQGDLTQLGHKALAVNLSDLAAMGASPRFALVALGLPEGFEPAKLDALYDGLQSLATEHRVSIVGGNISRSPLLTITITLLGSLAGPALIRGGGKPGDHLFLTGPVGSSALGRQLLLSGREPKDDEERACIARHLTPTPRVAVGETLRLIASAGIDVSDGLAQDAKHLTNASKCGARINLEALPRSPKYDELTQNLDDPWQPALSGGEDYELLLAVPKEMCSTAKLNAAQVGTELVEIGELIQDDELLLLGSDGAVHPPPPGWSHF